MFGFNKTSFLRLCGITPPPLSRNTPFTLFVKYENAFTCQKDNDSAGGGCHVKNVYLFFICLIQKMTILDPQEAVQLSKYGNKCNIVYRDC